MTIETEIAGLTQATTDLLDAVNVRKATLDAKVTEATSRATDAANSATASAASAASALNIYGNTAAMNTAVSSASTSATNAATSATNAANSATQAAASAASASALVLGSASNLPSIAPSLNLDFANSKQLDPRIAFSRDSKATYYDGKTTAKAEENLLKYSQEFDTGAWALTNATVIPNAIAAPNGELTADKLTESSASGGHYIAQSFIPQSSAAYVASVYIKKAERLFASIQCSFGGVNTFAIVNLTTGVFGTPTGSGTFNAVDAGNGWWRCFITVTTTSAALGYFIVYSALDSATVSFAGDGTSGIYIWGAQLEQRAFPTAYTPTTSSPITNYIPVLQTAASNAARIDHDPVTGECKGLLIEESRTNLFKTSEVASFWGNKYNCSIISDVAISPAGTQTVDKLVANTVNSAHRIESFFTLSPSSAYTISVYAKKAERNHVRFLAFPDNSVFSNQSAVFDLDTGSVLSNTAGTSASITNAGNGWYRCAFTVTSNSFSGTATGYFGIGLSNGATESFAGDGYSGVYIWGAQLEQGAFATSYIPTALTYSGRASTATYQGDDGFLATAAVNAPRYQRNAQGGKQLLLEGAGTNLLLASERFDDAAVWSKSALATVVPNTDVAPNGTLTADSILFSGANQAVAAMTASSIVGQTVTGSVYVKGTPGETIQIAVGGPDQAFTLDGTWQRLVATKTAAYNTFNINTYGGVTARSIKVWGAQLETGSVATSYMPSVDTFTGRDGPATYFDSTGVLRTAPANAPRYGYGYDASRAKWVSQGLLVETSAANLLTYSEQFDNAAWNKGNATITANAVTAPDGTSTADSVSIQASGYVYQAYTATYSAGAAFTWSVYVQSATRAVNFGGATPVGTDAYSSTPVGNGWYRQVLTRTFTNAGSGATIQAMVDALTFGVGSVNLWGAQLEAGPVATSYIATTNQQVTRAADSATSVGGTRAADVYSSAQATRVNDAANMAVTISGDGTIYTEFKSNSSMGSSDAVAANKYPMVFSIGGTNAYCYGTYMEAYVGGSYNGIGAVSTSAHKFALGFAASGGQSVSSLDGGAATNRSGFQSTTSTVMYIGGNGGTSMNALSGYIKKLSYYPKRLSNSELQALTA